MPRIFIKLFVFILLFQISGRYGYSQKHPQLQTLGIKSGVGLYGIRSGEFYDDFDKNLSFHIAPVLNYSLSDDILICAGVGFELKGAPDSRYNYNTRLSYLVVPVYGKYLFNKTPRFYGLAGIYGGYLLTATRKGEIKLGPNVTPVDENVLSEFRKIDFGIIAGAGYMIRLNIDVDFFVELKANIGLADIEKSQSFRPRNNGYTLSLGYLYYIGFR
jgi:hypothetical protein